MITMQALIFGSILIYFDPLFVIYAFDVVCELLLLCCLTHVLSLTNFNHGACAMDGIEYANTHTHIMTASWRDYR